MELQDELITESGKTDREFAVATVRREVVKAICPTLKKGFIVNDLQLMGDVVFLRARKNSWTADGIQWTQQADMEGSFIGLYQKVAQCQVCFWGILEENNSL